jgi:APA family basic amino acid/polyamine antiporter
LLPWVWLLLNLPYLYAPLSDKNILYEIGIFKLNAAQIVSIFTIILLSYINSRWVKNSKILQTVLTVIKILSLAGLIIFGFMAKAEVWDANWTNAWTSQTLNVETGSWLPISGTALISGISAALVGSMFSSVAWEGVTFIAGEIKSKQRGIEFVLGTLIVSVIYILANIMYLAVVPLYDIATARIGSCGCGGFAKYFFVL